MNSNVKFCFLLSGLCVAVKGVEIERGEFEVSEFITAGYPPQDPISLST
jgi:hypothetical protein